MTAPAETLQPCAVKVLDYGYVQLVESWGSDERIIEAARMSTSKGFQGWPQDEKLLGYLWTHKHLTPFEMAGAIVEVQAPLFVFREWQRHRTQSYNELSARYTELPDLYYVPSVERLMASAQSATNRQGSEAGISRARAEMIRQTIAMHLAAGRGGYEELLRMGVAREVARVVVPVAQYSRMRASANLRNWLAFLDLRLPASAQWEIRQYANVVEALLTEKFPRTLSLFRGTHG